jgi:hypothetical protein
MTRVGWAAFCALMGHGSLPSTTLHLLFLGTGLNLALLDIFSFLYNRKQPVALNFGKEELTFYVINPLMVCEN